MAAPSLPAQSTSFQPSPVPPSQKISTGHTSPIHDLQLDYYSQRLATCSSDGTIRLFKVDPPTPLTTLSGHTGPVWRICWAHPKHGSILASCGFDGKVIVWLEDRENVWREYYSYNWHGSSVNAVQFAPHEFGLMFACASSDGYVSVCKQNDDGSWNETRVSEGDSGDLPTHAMGVNGVSFGPSVNLGGLWKVEKAGKPKGVRLVTGGADGLVKVWIMEGDKWKVEEGGLLTGHRELVRDVAWAPDIGTNRDLIASVGAEGKVYIWELEEGQKEWRRKEVGSFDKDVWSVNWSNTGSVLGIAAGDDEVSLWKEDPDGKWSSVTDIMKDAAQPKVV